MQNKKSSVLDLEENRSSVVYKAINEIFIKHGFITAEIIVSEAKEKNHPLHNRFEWDDCIAAKNYRLQQARCMIIAQKYVFEVREKKTSEIVIPIKTELRKFLPDQTTIGTFVDRKKALVEVESRATLIDKKIIALKSWCNSVIDISELSKIRRIILENI